MKYDVEMVELASYLAQVEADSQKEALEKARKLAEDGKFCLKPTAVLDRKFTATIPEFRLDFNEEDAMSADVISLINNQNTKNGEVNAE